MDDFLKGNWMTGLLLFVGAVIVWPVVAPLVRGAAKTTIKGGMMLYDEGARIVSETTETTNDLFAEAQHELQHEHQRAPHTPASPHTAS